MNYEYLIDCLKCGCRVASGNFPEQVSLSNADVMGNAQHNPSCPVPACRDASRITITNKITNHDHAVVSEYIIKYS